MFHGLLHDIMWSFREGKLHELFLHDGITFATWGLVLVTILTVLDGWRRGKEQQERWSREDTEAGKEKLPKYQFGLKRTIRPPKRVSLSEYLPEPAIHLWVANLGLSGIYVDKLLVKHRDFGQAELNVNEVVSAGGQLKFDIPDAFWEEVPGIKVSDGNYLYGDHEVWLELSDSNGAFASPRILHQFLYMQHSFSELNRGSYEDRQPKCPKCGSTLNAVLLGTGLLSEVDVQTQFWQPILQDLERSCPDHSCAHLKTLEDNTPLWFVTQSQGEVDA